MYQFGPGSVSVDVREGAEVGPTFVRVGVFKLTCPSFGVFCGLLDFLLCWTEPSHDVKASPYGEYHAVASPSFLDVELLIKTLTCCPMQETTKECTLITFHLSHVG
jgi:hypothetical protein